MEINHLDGIRSSFVNTKRIKTYMLSAGESYNPPIVFLHGNASASTIWEELMIELSDSYFCIAPDLRGYGNSDPNEIIDATRGMLDWVEDLESLADALKFETFHLVGHSLGGSVCWGAIPEMGRRISSVTLMAPGPPCGFGGIKGETGIPNNPDYSGSGAGVVNQTFANNLSKELRDTDDDMFSPRTVMHRLFWHDGFQPGREEQILTAMLQIHSGYKKYPGDHKISSYWPGVAPGRYGPVNALSPKYNGEVAINFSTSEYKPPVFWVHGSNDRIISDESFSDPGYQGKAGFRSGWPGEEKFPPQPMLTQIRYALSKYKLNGGETRELEISGSGHTPFLEKPKTVWQALRQYLDKHSKSVSTEDS